MFDDDGMDRLLKATLAAAVPEPSAEFDARLARRLRPRRLTTAGRVVLVLYGVLSAGVAAWHSRDLPMAWVAAALGIGGTVAAVAGAYARRIALGR